MDRRTYLAASVAALAGTAGCGQRLLPTSESRSDPVTGTNFTAVAANESRRPLPNAEYATAEFRHDDAQVVVGGAVDGGGGCEFRPVLDEWAWNGGRNRLNVTVTTTTEQREACPSVDRPPVHYRFTAQFQARSLPEAVRIVHAKGGVDVYTVTVRNLHA